MVHFNKLRFLSLFPFIINMSLARFFLFPFQKVSPDKLECLHQLTAHIELAKHLCLPLCLKLHSVKHLSVSQPVWAVVLVEEGLSSTCVCIFRCSGETKKEFGLANSLRLLIFRICLSVSMSVCLGRQFE